MAKLSGLKQALLIGGGGPSGSLIKQTYQSLASALGGPDFAVICADSGGEVYQRLRSQNTLKAPDAVLGDFDSSRAHAYPPGTEVQQFAEEKDASDLELCFQYALGRSARAVVAVVATQGAPQRFDHVLTNVALAQSYAQQLESMILATEQGHFRFFRGGGRCQLGAGPFSLLTFSCARGLTIRGAKYSLESFDLAPSSRGLSNFAEQTVELSYQAGDLIVFTPRLEELLDGFAS